MELTWGLVTDVTPGAVLVRFNGDSADTPIALQLDSTSALTTSSQVVLGKLGKTGTWTILGVLEAT